MEMSEEDLKQTPPVEPIAGGLVYHQFVKPAALPTALSYAGAALGGGVGTPFGLTVPGAVAGGAVGSMAGEGLNQALGITEPSLSQIGLAGAVPAAIGGIGTGFRAARPFLSSGRAAQTLNALTPEEVTQMREASRRAAHLFNADSEMSKMVALYRRLFEPKT